MTNQSITVVVAMNIGQTAVRTETYRLEVNETENPGLTFHALTTAIMDWVIQREIEKAKGQK